MKRKTILVANDNEDIQYITTLHLRRSGYLVIQARNGLETLAKLREDKPDLLLLDLVMPKLDGIEVLKRVKKDPELQAIPVVIFSAYEESGQCMELGANNYIAWPCFAELPEKVSAALS